MVAPYSQIGVSRDISSIYAFEWQKRPFGASFVAGGDRKVKSIYLNRKIVDKLFGVEGVSTEILAEKFSSAYDLGWSLYGNREFKDGVSFWEMSDVNRGVQVRIIRADGRSAEAGDILIEAIQKVDASSFD